MLFSRSAEYAVRAMTFLAMQPSGKLCGAKEIAEAENIPIPFLWKILQNLARRRLIRSFKGSRGGYELAIPADQITLRALVIATDGEDLASGCVLGLDTCSEHNACPLHDTWKRIRGEMDAMMEQNTLSDLARVAKRRSGKKGT